MRRSHQTDRSLRQRWFHSDVNGFGLVRLVAGSWLTHRRRPHTRDLCRVGHVGSIDVRLPRPAASHQSDHSRRAHVEITVRCRIGVGRSLSSGDNIRCLDRQRSDFTVRWHLVGDRRAGDEPNTDIITPATETSTSRSSWMRSLLRCAPSASA
jgi:hypothetical protein